MSPLHLVNKSNGTYYLPGADPGFPVGGVAIPPDWGGANIQISQIFPKNCMKLRKFWSVVGGGGRHCLQSLLSFFPLVDGPEQIVSHDIYS